MYTGFWWGNLKERDYIEDPGIDGRIILRWIFRRWDAGAWTGLGKVANTCKCGNEPSGSIQHG